MEITLHQRFNNKEPILWTVNQLNTINIDWGLINDRVFTIDDVKIFWPYYETHETDHLNLRIQPGVNVIVIDENYDKENFINFIDLLITHNKSEFKFFLIFSKQVENYWGIVDTENDMSLFNKINETENIKVFWDVSTYKMKNFIFSPKIQIQSYFNNEKADGLDVYLYAHQEFLKLKKNKRIGIHINKLSNYLRIYLAENFINKGHENIFCTVNENNSHNKNLINHRDIEGYFNFKSMFPEFNIADNGLTYLWYAKQLFEHGLKTDMEVVYETHTYYPHKQWCFKLTEKTIKHLFLGKPFIHTDPNAHQLLTLNGFRNYKDLYIDDLINFYNNWDTNNITNERTMHLYFSLLKKNIEWINDMSEEEWLERYDVSLFLAQENRAKVVDLIYNTSLLVEIKTLL